jgi:predicted enzyme related to lactoylglutathione lyase
MGPGEIYTLFEIPGATSEHAEGGMMKMPEAMKGIPPFWLTYFGTEDVDGTAKKVTELGGKVVVQPMDIPNIGRFATCTDPQGAAFAVFKPLPRQR